MNPPQHQIEAAIKGFLRVMRIEHVKLYPDEVNIRVPVYDQLDLRNRSILYRAMKEALKEAAKPHKPEGTHT
jgi:hypothetical protein